MDLPANPKKRAISIRRVALISAWSLVLWAALAYAVLPFGWRHFEHECALADRDMLTRTSQGIAGDPINIGFVGEEADIGCAFHAAGWYAANPVTFASSLPGPARAWRAMRVDLEPQFRRPAGL